MKKRWIEPGNWEQELWAQKYLIKKRYKFTQSVEGEAAATNWGDGKGEHQSALDFLMELESQSDEATVVLLRKMKAAWLQRVRSKTNRKRIVKISLRASSKLKYLANQVRKSQASALELLINENYLDVQKNVIDEKSQTKELKERLKKATAEGRKELSGKILAQKELLEMDKELDTCRTDHNLLCQKYLDLEQEVENLIAKNIELVEKLDRDTES